MSKMEYAQQSYPSSDNENEIIIFLIGPNGNFWKDRGPLATSSWRRELLEKLNLSSDKIRWIIPEPELMDWAYIPNFDQWIFDEVDWEDQWMERADILVINMDVKWSGNIGPSVRFEVGKYIDAKKEIILHIPDDADSVKWLRYHAKKNGIPIYQTWEEVITILNKKIEVYIL